MPTLYRTENLTDGIGLWYDTDGNLVETIRKIDNALNRDLPMGFDSDFAGGWISATDQPDQLKLWVPRRDMDLLANSGFVINGYEVTDYRIGRGEGGIEHALFRREDVIRSWNIPFSILDE